MRPNAPGDEAFERVQAALSRLYTLSSDRELLASEPDVYAQRRGLTGEDLATLRQIPQEELARFARSLLRKRLNEVRKLLPKTAEALGDLFGQFFFSFAADRPTQGVSRHLTDAVEFARHLRRTLARQKAQERRLFDLVRYESARLQMENGRRMFRLLWLDHRPERLTAGEVTGREEPSRGKSLMIWFRWPGQSGVREFVFPARR